MIRYSSRRAHQTKVMFRDAHVQVVTSRQLCDQRYFTHHTIDRITVKEFLTALGISIGPRAVRALTRRAA